MGVSLLTERQRLPPALPNTLNSCFNSLENIDDLRGFFRRSELIAQIVVAKNAHQGTDKAQIFRIHGFRNSDQDHKSNWPIRFLDRYCEPSKCHDHFCHSRRANMRYGQPVLEFHFPGTIASPKSLRKFLP